MSSKVTEAVMNADSQNVKKFHAEEKRRKMEHDIYVFHGAMMDQAKKIAPAFFFGGTDEWDACYKDLTFAMQLVLKRMYREFTDGDVSSSG